LWSVNFNYSKLQKVYFKPWKGWLVSVNTVSVLPCFKSCVASITVDRG